MEEKQKRVIFKTPSDHLNHPTYRTIIYILWHVQYRTNEFKSGLETKELRYLIVKGYDRKKDIRGFKRINALDILKEKLKHLERTYSIELDQDISKSYEGFDNYLRKLRKNWIKKIGDHWIFNEKYFQDFYRMRRQKILTDTDSDKVISSGTLTLYSGDIRKKEIIEYPELKDIWEEINLDINNIVHKKLWILFSVIRIRRAFDRWEKELLNPSVPSLSLFYLWLKILFFSVYGVRSMSKGIILNESEVKDKNISKIRNDFSMMQENRETFFNQVLEKAVVRYVTKKHPSSKINVSYISSLNNEYRTSLDRVLNEILIILSKELPYILTIDNFSEVDEDNLQKNIRKLEESFDFQMKKRSIDKKAIMDELLSKTVNNYKSSSKLARKFHGKFRRYNYFLKDYLRFLSTRYTYGLDTYFIIREFFPYLGEKLPSFEVLKKLKFDWYVPGLKIKKRIFFVSNEFFSSLEQELIKLSFINGKKEKKVFLPDYMFKVNFVVSQPFFPPFKNINDLHRKLDKSSKVFSMPPLPKNI